MKISIKKKVNVDAKWLHVHAGVRYWEDATVNGVEDESGDLIPCRNGDYWEPRINIETGEIVNWKHGVKADIHYKVCDDGKYTLKDTEGNNIISKEDYVISSLSINDEGYGDYIIMTVDENGIIKDWKFNLKDFDNSDEEED